MDLNPQIPEWTSAEGPYELADYAISNKANVLLLLNSWLDSGKELDEPNDWHTLNYWAVRTRPLWTDGKGDASSDEEDHKPDSETTDSGDETIVVICNRSGEENGTIASTILVHLPSPNTFSQAKFLLEHPPYSVCDEVQDAQNCWT